MEQMEFSHSPHTPPRWEVENKLPHMILGGAFGGCVPGGPFPDFPLRHHFPTPIPTWLLGDRAVLDNSIQVSSSILVCTFHVALFYMFRF